MSDISDDRTDYAVRVQNVIGAVRELILNGLPGLSRDAREALWDMYPPTTLRLLNLAVECLGWEEDSTIEDMREALERIPSLNLSSAIVWGAAGFVDDLRTEEVSWLSRDEARVWLPEVCEIFAERAVS